MIGQTISHYKIIEKLGEGGMGVVYKAEDIKLHRPVALKVLPRQALVSEQDKTRFAHEAQAAASLSHPNIATIFEFDEVDDPLTGGKLAFIAMEYLEGETLKEKSQERPLPINEAVDIAIDVVEGLAKAHQKGIIHRDIKSENVMITPDGEVKIMDFGLAEIAGRSRVTKEGMTVGTAAYMSPEQALGERLDQRTDIWSLGVVLYEMITGRLPFAGDYEQAIVYRILHEEPESLTSLRSNVPMELERIVKKAMRRERDNRYQHIDELLVDLKHLIELKRIDTLMEKEGSTAEAKEKSIAVLYFENLSSDKESDYFCAGMTEDIITDLSKIKELKVVSRTDVLPFRNKEINTQRIGEALKVKYILEGSMRKAGDKVRINAQLIDVQNGFHVWADRFDRKLEDIFELQNEASQKIAEALRVTLTASEKEALAKKPTANLEAYDYYLRGKDFAWRRSKRDNEYAIEMFQKALIIDPNFSLAHTGLAEAYSYKYQWWDIDKSVVTKAIEASQKAVHLDPDLPEAHFALGLAYQIQNQLEEAKREYQIAISLKPDFYDAYRWLGHAHDLLGELEEAAGCYRKAAEIKPFSEEPVLFLEMNRRKKGDLEESENLTKKLIELIEKKLDVNPDDSIALSRAASTYVHLEMKEEALKAIKRSLEIDPDDGLFLYNISCAYARMGDKKQALRHLKKAIKSGWRVREWAQADPDLANIRDEPEFQSLVKQMH